MADFLSPEARSRLMSRVRQRDTRPELFVRKAIWQAGFRYRLHVKKLPGSPDLVFPKYRLVVFVHGCFWHQHGCAKSARPSSNSAFWDPKLDGNVARDLRAQTKLKELGWSTRAIGNVTWRTAWKPCWCICDVRGTDPVLAARELQRRNLELNTERVRTNRHNGFRMQLPPWTLISG